MAINPHNLEVEGVLGIEPAGGGLDRSLQDISLTVKVTDNTSWFDRDYVPIERLMFRAQLIGEAWDGDPGPTGLGPFGLTVYTTEWRCRHVISNGRVSMRCERVPVSHVREDHEFRTSDAPNDNKVVLGRSVGMTVDVGLLDVDRAIERPIDGGTKAQAEVIFAKVQVIDRDDRDGNPVVKTAVSNRIPGYAEFGDF